MPPLLHHRPTDEGSPRAFTIADVASFPARRCDGLAHLVITGGEPLVFPDFDQIIEAVDPQKFYISSDTNGCISTRRSQTPKKKSASTRSS